MSYTMFCPRCGKNVQVKEVWDSKSLVTMIVLLVMGLIPGIVYILVKTLAGDKCPECGYTINMMMPPLMSEDGTPQDRPQEVKFCLFCDAAIPKDAEICPKCKNRVRRRPRIRSFGLSSNTINLDALSIPHVRFFAQTFGHARLESSLRREARPVKGKLSVVGFGPGALENMTIRAERTIREADKVIGYTAYIDMIKGFFPEDTQYISTGMMREVERCKMAVEEAMKGQKVAMVSSGDSGIYGMAGIVYEVAAEMKADIDIDVVPGMTAASTAASVLGAPLMHDLAIISLSDLMTPIDLIMRRVDCAGQGDFIVALYNPKSKKRTDYLEQAADILMKYRSPDTPVGVVRNAGREGEQKQLTTLGGLKDADVDMFSIVIIGNSNTYVRDGLMITPRGYREKGRMEGVL